LYNKSTTFTPKSLLIMKKTWLLYGLFLGFLGVVLRFSEYWFWIKFHTFDLYAVLVAGIFLGVGLWLGNQLQHRKLVEKSNDLIKNDEHNLIGKSKKSENTEGGLDTQILAKLNISKREHEVLVLLGRGMSNQEIADALFVSPNTVKTHASRLFEKLDVKNRTHALLKAKELGILPN
jgi:two-component system, NarL family, response regulator LiaR